MLFASSIDGNGQIVPIAMAHVPIENGENWHWFLTLLSRSLSLAQREVVVMSDREKGLVGVVKEAVPNCYPGYCVRHIVKNFLKYKVKVSELIWRAASTYSKKRFDECIRLIELVTPEGGSSIRDIPAERWANSHFPAKRFGHLTSNVAESCNAMMKGVRKHFPFNAVIEFLKKVSSIFNDRFQEHSRSTSTLGGNVQEKIKRSIEVSSSLSVGNARDCVFAVGRVKNGESLRIVDVVGENVFLWMVPRAWDPMLPRLCCDDQKRDSCGGSVFGSGQNGNHHQTLLGGDISG